MTKEEFIAEYTIILDKVKEFNQNHAADGKFGSGGDSGSGEDEHGLPARYRDHVTGSGPYDSQHDHTVSIMLDGEAHKFTNGWNKDDIEHMLTADYVYQFHGDDHTLKDVDIELNGHPDSMVTYSDTGKMTLFTNNQLASHQLEDIVFGVESQVDEHERQSGKIGSYDLLDQFDPSDNSVHRSYPRA